MFSILSNRGKVAYGQKEFVVDLASEISSLPTKCTPGSTAFVIETSQYYMLNNQRQWVKVNLASGSGTGGGGDLPEDGEVIYNGGVI
jgi:hypothetical protein